MAQADTPILAALERIWSSQGREFVTVEAVREGRADPDTWVQYLDGELNLSWPREDAPAEWLAAAGVPLPAGVTVLSWTPRGTAILAAGDLRAAQVAALMVSLLEGAAAGAPCRTFEVRTDRHG